MLYNKFGYCNITNLVIAIFTKTENGIGILPKKKQIFFKNCLCDTTNLVISTFARIERERCCRQLVKSNSMTRKGGAELTVPGILSSHTATAGDQGQTQQALVHEKAKVQDQIPGLWVRVHSSAWSMATGLCA